MYPVMLDVKGLPCLVVGGGPVAVRKARGLVAEDARVRVVAPEGCAELDLMVLRRLLTWERRPFQPQDVEGQVLVMVAVDDPEVSRQVAREARARGIWVNVADDPEGCTFHLPAHVRRGALHVAVASGGAAPFAVRRLKQVLESHMGPEWGEWMGAAERFRARVRETDLPAESREAAYDAFFRATVWTPRAAPGQDPGPQGADRTWRPRIPSAQEAEALVSGAPAAPFRPGLVSLVGAGPGDPGLLTLRGWQRLMEARHIVMDRLAEAVLPSDLPPTTQIHYVGKEAGFHLVPQDQIHALLVRLAREGHPVVRLKGGDPFVFGRGSEEALALSEAGIPFEVVPGVSAAMGVPAAAGIPLTHRDLVQSVTLFTAHRAREGGRSMPWATLTGDPHRTLIGFMGLATLTDTVAGLVGAGMDPQTPAAMIERGTLPTQRVVRAPLEHLPQAVREAGLASPALLVTGPTVDVARILEKETG